MLQVLVHLDVKNDEGKFQAFIFNSMWDIHAQTCQCVNNKHAGRRQPL